MSVGFYAVRCSCSSCGVADDELQLLAPAPVATLALTMWTSLLPCASSAVLKAVKAAMWLSDASGTMSSLAACVGCGEAAATSVKSTNTCASGTGRMVR